MRPEQRLRKIRKDRGLSQADVAEMAHIAQRTYARYEAGQRNMPDGLIELLAIKFDVPYEWLKTGES
jgi:transcriptional regulator with XRE-family HTH domain